MARGLHQAVPYPIKQTFPQHRTERLGASAPASWVARCPADRDGQPYLADWAEGGRLGV